MDSYRDYYIFNKDTFHVLFHALYGLIWGSQKHCGGLLRSDIKLENSKKTVRYAFREILNAEIKLDGRGNVYRIRIPVAYQPLLETLDRLGLWNAMDDQHTFFEFHGCMDSIQIKNLPIAVKICINDREWHKIDNIEVRITRNEMVLSGYFVSFIIQKYSTPVMRFENEKGLEFVNRLYISSATSFDREWEGIKYLTPLPLEAADLNCTVDRWTHNDAVDYELVRTAISRSRGPIYRFLAVGYALDYCRRDLDICKELHEHDKKTEEIKMKRKSLAIKKIIINNPATIILWMDGDKTVVKCQDGDTFDAEKGIAMCVMKRCLGTNATDSNYLDIIRKKIDSKKREK